MDEKRAWDNFYKTGRVDYYLQYRHLMHNRPMEDITESEEIQSAHYDRWSGNQTTQF